MASKEDVIKALSKILERLELPSNKAIFASFTKTILFTFTDLQASFCIEIENGVVKKLLEFSSERPDIIVSSDSNTFFDIVDNKLNPINAYSTGKLKVQGSFLDLLKLQKLMRSTKPSLF
ncbi:MAG: SCP2 sterol-binding domain-containing protein [Nitrososphaeria archaeon]